MRDKILKIFQDNLRIVVILGVYGIVTLFFLWPIAIHPRTQLPDLGDSLHAIWILENNSRKIFTDPLDIYNTNIYFPEGKGSGVFAESMILESVLYTPFRLIREPVFGYNFQLLLSFLLSAFFMYKISYLLTKNHRASFLSGIVFGFFPFKFAHLPHLQLMGTEWILIPLYFQLKILKGDNRPLTLVSFGIFFFLKIISWGYLTAFLLFLTIMNLIFLPDFILDKRKQGWDATKKFLLVSVPLILLALPFYSPYYKAFSEGSFRTEPELISSGNDIAFSFITNPLNKLWKLKPDLNYHEFGETWLISGTFPGIVIFIVTILSLLTWREGLHLSLKDKEKNLFMLLSLLGIVLSCGPRFKLLGNNLFSNPVYAITTLLIFGRSLRYIPAYVFITMFGVAGIIAHGAKKISSNIIFPLVILLLVFELQPQITTQNMPPFSKHVPEKYVWVKNSNTRSLLEMPIEKHISGDDPYWYNQFRYMYYSAYHGSHLVNGITGVFPVAHRDIIASLNNFPDERSLLKIKEIGVEKVLINTRDYLPGEASLIKQSLEQLEKEQRIDIIKEFNDESLIVEVK